jgi:hypothetical protein
MDNNQETFNKVNEIIGLAIHQANIILAEEMDSRIVEIRCDVNYLGIRTIVQKNCEERLGFKNIPERIIRPMEGGFFSG